MTKTYCLKRLLEHGPMTIPEIVECTRWGNRQVKRALLRLRQQGLVRVASRLHGTRAARWEAAPCR